MSQEIGSTATCGACGKQITYGGKHWYHNEGNPLHIPKPAGAICPAPRDQHAEWFALHCLAERIVYSANYMLSFIDSWELANAIKMADDLSMELERIREKLSHL